MGRLSATEVPKRPARRRLRGWARAVFALVASGAVAWTPAAPPTPVEVAPGVYAVLGSTDDPTPENRAQVGNSGFIVGESGVVLIDTGSSYEHGRALIAAAERIAGKPAVLAIVTQPLQEFVMGAAAFEERGIPMLAQTRTAQMIAARCENCLKNLRKLLGDEPMQGTRVLAPSLQIDATETRVVAGRSLLLWHPDWAATPGDLLVLDVRTGVAFSGSLVSVRRIPDLRDGDLAGWRQALDAMGRLPIRRLVPGYGPVTDLTALAPMRAYFDAVEQQATALLEAGRSLLEAAQNSELPAYADWDLYARGHPRNLQQVYLKLEAAGIGR
jgi:glyoxylase-like metal-dependent hydrolase (beta-lactamase superfamily II)